LARSWQLLQLQLALGFNPIFKIVSVAVTTALPELVGADCGGQMRHYRKLLVGFDAVGFDSVGLDSVTASTLMALSAP